MSRTTERQALTAEVASPDRSVDAVEEAHAPGCGCGGCGPRLSPARVLGLQAAAGNAAVARAVSVTGAQRATLARVIDDTAYNAGRQARDDWVKGGVRGPIDHAPSTGRGGFSVSYDPTGQLMTVELKGAVDFRDGMDIWLGTFVRAQQPDNGPARQAAEAINKLPRAERRAAMAPWLWTPEAKATFLDEFRTSIQGAWAKKHEFHCSKDFWTDLGAKVDVKVTVAEGEKAGSDHMKVVSYKESDATVNSTPAHVADTSTFSHDANDNEMVVNSVQTRRRKDIMQSAPFTFDSGKATLDSTSKAALKDFGNSYKNGGGPRCGSCGKEISEAAAVKVNVEVPADGTDASLADKRFASVTAELVAGGMTDAATRCTKIVAGSGTGGQVRMGAGIQQIVVAHEAGHMFGLDDEYTAPFAGTGGDLGSPTDGNLGPSQGLPGGVAENSDTIMSVGDAVKPQHYATFLEALKAVTAMSDWVFGPPVPVVAPAAGADIDTPTGPAGPPGAPARAPTAVA